MPQVVKPEAPRVVLDQIPLLARNQSAVYRKMNTSLMRISCDRLTRIMRQETVQSICGHQPTNTVFSASRIRGRGRTRSQIY